MRRASQRRRVADGGRTLAPHARWSPAAAARPPAAHGLPAPPSRACPLTAHARWLQTAAARRRLRTVAGCWPPHGRARPLVAHDARPAARTSALLALRAGARIRRFAVEVGFAGWFALRF